MTTKHIHGQFIINYLINCAQKKGKNNKVKNLILKSAKKASKSHIKRNFNGLLENLFQNLILPFKIKSERRRKRNTHVTNYTSIANITIDLLKQINNSQNKTQKSFYFNFIKVIDQLINNINRLNITKDNNIKLYNKIDLSYNTFVPKNNIGLINTIYKKNIIKHYFLLYRINYIFGKMYEHKLPTSTIKSIIIPSIIWKNLKCIKTV